MVFCTCKMNCRTTRGKNLAMTDLMPAQAMITAAVGIAYTVCGAACRMTVQPHATTHS